MRENIIRKIRLRILCRYLRNNWGNYQQTQNLAVYRNLSSDSMYLRLIQQFTLTENYIYSNSYKGILIRGALIIPVRSCKLQHYVIRTIESQAKHTSRALKSDDSSLLAWFVQIPAFIDCRLHSLSSIKCRRLCSNVVNCRDIFGSDCSYGRILGKSSLCSLFGSAPLLIRSAEDATHLSVTLEAC